ncbi:Leucine-rich repeat receptor-like serine/threonine/tyrosine-protein kinase SOBIR1 [Platanthera zijinensis]|uniref:Leucine-rich repeat receptor-like serine/threonine/tyrosine-protein kinase SOBIR1 n=1 Tax=Platanthera zijinensis TaxID=2320716 RepID=A0AAP0BCF3_9ASPA
MTSSSTAAVAAALVPFFVFLSILTAGATDADTLHRVISRARLPRPDPDHSNPPCLSSGGSCKSRASFGLSGKSGVVRDKILSFSILAESGARAPEPSAASENPSPTAFSRNPRQHRKSKRKVRNWIIGFVVGSISGLVSGLVFSTLFRVVLNCIGGRYRTREGTQLFSRVFKNKDELNFLEKDNGVEDLELIGRGASGEVYRKEIKTSGGVKEIAIKKIKTHATDGDQPMSEQESRLLNKWMGQIRSEIKTVGRIRHRNLIPLLAHVFRRDCHYLVYEYMKNGSLHDVLRDSAEGSRELDWPARLRIALGIAAGLEHLHIHHKPHIVHRDLKPGNVLLDDNMEARISDFGLAKEIPDANTHMTTGNVAGTVGYIAPEYYQTMKYTTKSDIFSFGVILAVMVMGRFPSDSFFQETEEMSLVKWMRNQLSAGNASACFDEKIAGRGQDDQLELALKVACFCSADLPSNRPTCKEVRVMLAQIGSG